MVTINNEELRSVYHYLITINNVIEKEILLVKGDKSRLDKLVPAPLREIYSAKQKTALGFIDNLQRVNYENSVIALVAVFERIAVAKYRTSYGAIKTTIKHYAVKPLAYYDSRERLVNDKIDNLAGVFYLLEGIIDHDIFDKLKIIKDHRNYLAHGQRDSQPPANEFSIDEIASILDKVILEIAK